MLKGNSIIIEPQTAAAISTPFRVNENAPVTIVGTVLGADTIPIEVSYDGTSWEPVGAGGTATELSATNNPVTVYGPGLYRVNKGITAGAAGVSLWEAA